MNFSRQFNSQWKARRVLKRDQNAEKPRHAHPARGWCCETAGVHSMGIHLESRRWWWSNELISRRWSVKNGFPPMAAFHPNCIICIRKTRNQPPTRTVILCSTHTTLRLHSMRFCRGASHGRVDSAGKSILHAAAADREIRKQRRRRCRCRWKGLPRFYFCVTTCTACCFINAIHALLTGVSRFAAINLSSSHCAFCCLFQLAALLVHAAMNTEKWGAKIP